MKKTVLICAAAIVVLSILVDQAYRSPLVDERVEKKTELACKYTVGVVPPKKFVSDGCSLFPEGFNGASWEKCCMEHDAVYWCGGEPESRANADADLAECVHDVAPGLATMMEVGARVGGVSWLPTPWRWGYGWNYFEK